MKIIASRDELREIMEKMVTTKKLIELFLIDHGIDIQDESTMRQQIIKKLTSERPTSEIEQLIMAGLRWDVKID